MRLQTVSLVFAMLALLLLPVALNGCGSTDHSPSSDANALRAGGAYVIGPGFTNTMGVASLPSSASIQEVKP
jgi:hypothetical protein